MLASIFSREVRKDLIYIIFQHMPSEEFMNALADCLKEEIPINIVNLKDDAELKLGTVYFIHNQYHYVIDNNWIKKLPTKSPKGNN